MAQGLIERVKSILLSPKAAWDAIDTETIDPQNVIISYVAPLAAIPAIASIIGLSVIGAGPFKIGLGATIPMAIAQFVLAIVFVFVFAIIINALAPTFGAQKNFNQALKVSAFAPTAAWVAGIFQVIPLLGILTLAGAVYTLYLLFVGLPKMMKPPAEKATVYTIVSILAAIFAAIIMNFAVGMFTPKPGLGAIKTAGGESVDLGRRAEAMEEAAESGDLSAMMEAATGILGGDPNAPVVEAAALRELAPQRLAGLNRHSLNVESMNAPFKMIEMSARYGDPDEESGDMRSITLKVINSRVISAVMGVSSIAGAEYDRSSDDGYERLTREGDSMIIEEWNNSSNSGRYGRSIGKSFLVEASGRDVKLNDLKEAVGEITEAKLNKLPRAE